MTRWDQARELLRLGRRRPANGVEGGPFEARAADEGARAPGGLGAIRSLGARARKAVRAAPVANDDTGAVPDAGPRARSVCIASGKGGTGKSSVSASLATLFSRRGRTLLLDADLGCANAHILQDVHPEHSFADVIAGDRGVADIVTPCRKGLDLLPGGSGFARLAGLRTYELEMIGRGLARLEPEYEYLVVDSAAGLSRQTVAFAAACDLTVLVTTPDVTAMTDAYAFLKVFVRQCSVQGIDRPMPLLVVNRVADAVEGEQVARRLQDVVMKFLGQRLEFLAMLPDDRAAFRCIQRRTTVADGEPDSELGRALAALSNGVLSRAARVESRGAGRRLVDAAVAEKSVRRR
ncbi:MAG: P-loop NTPase [Planctomycetota bacterium]